MYVLLALISSAAALDGLFTFTFPPSGFIVNFDECTSHCAVIVVFAVGLYFVPASYTLLSADDFHPLNVFSFFVGASANVISAVSVCMLLVYVAVILSVLLLSDGNVYVLFVSFSVPLNPSDFVHPLNVYFVTFVIVASWFAGALLPPSVLYVTVYFVVVSVSSAFVGSSYVSVVLYSCVYVLLALISSSVAVDGLFIFIFPPSGSIVNFDSVTVHFAYSVVSLLNSTFPVYVSPVPSCFVFHPAKSYPSLVSPVPSGIVTCIVVILFKLLLFTVTFPDCESGTVPVPSFTSNDTVMFFSYVA